MAFRGTRVDVGTTAVKVVAATHGRASGSGALLQNAGSADIDLGGDGVTAGAGFPLGAGESVSVELEPGESLYAIVASGTESLAILEGGV